MSHTSEDEVRIVGFRPNQAGQEGLWAVIADSPPFTPTDDLPVRDAMLFGQRFALAGRNDITSSESPPTLMTVPLPNIPPLHRRPSRQPSRRSSRRASARPSNPKPIAKSSPELQQLCDTLTRLSQQLHVLSQRRIAERAAANATDPDPKPETCPICFDNFHCPGTCATRCGHVFHAKCLDACLVNSNACPVCRANVYKAELVELMSGFGEKDEREDAVVDLINESGTEERGEMDEGIISTLRSVRESIDNSQAVDKLNLQALEEKVKMKEEMTSRQKLIEDRTTKFEKEVAAKEGALRRRTERITRTEEVVQQKHEELNEKLCELRKRESALQIQQAEVEAESTENMKMRDELEKDKSIMREKERRMTALQDAQKQRKLKEREDENREKIRILEQLLRTKGIPIPMERDTERRRDTERKRAPDRDAFKVDLNDEVCFVESPVKRRKVSTPCRPAFLDVFGSDLKKPSLYSRPQAPRRRGVGIDRFAPERRTLQRPAGVAKRGLNISRR